MQQDLATNKIPIALLTGVHITVNLSFSVVPWNEPAREMFYSGGNAVRTEKQIDVFWGTGAKLPVSRLTGTISCTAAGIRRFCESRGHSWSCDSVQPMRTRPSMKDIKP